MLNHKLERVQAPYLTSVQIIPPALSLSLSLSPSLPPSSLSLPLPPFLSSLHSQKYKQGFIVDPVCLSPESTLRDLRELKKKCGFSGIPITESGKLGTKLKGIVTSRDVDFLDDDSMDRRLSDVRCYTACTRMLILDKILLWNTPWVMMLSPHGTCC